MATDPKTRYPLIALTKPEGDWDWSDNPGTFGVQMALIHNVFIRCLNSIYYHAPLVKTADQSSFIAYCLVWTNIIHDHHHGEEEIIFPFLQEKYDMQDNVDQHKAFTEKLQEFESYLNEVNAGKQEYDGEKIRQLVEAFGDVLVEHLHEEIPTISPERLGAYEPKDLDAMIDKHLEHIKQGSLTTSFVLVATHHDPSVTSTWPPLPKPLDWIIRNVGFWRHSSYWKFAPFTRQGQPAQAYA